MPGVLYKPAEIIRIIGAESADTKANAKQGLGAAFKQQDGDWRQTFKVAAGAVMDLGRGAFAELMHRRAEGLWYQLHDDGIEVSQPPVRRKVPYGEVRAILRRPGDRYVVQGSFGKITISPIAHLVAGQIKVPIGWIRNGLDVPFETLIDELAARAEVEVEEG